MAVALTLIGILAIPAGVLLRAIALLWGGADRLIRAIERQIRQRFGRGRCTHRPLR